MPSSAVLVAKNVNIASYVTTLPTLLLWMYIFVRMMVQKATAKFYGLLLIAALMIVS